MAFDSQDTSSDLYSALIKLHATGEEGFEGLIRDAYREVTGIGLRLAKSGAQQGVDAGPEYGDQVLLVGIEAKRYGQQTRLPVDELKYKLHEAATRNTNPVELWVLAASKEIASDDVAQLERIGDAHGVGVVVLDWKSPPDPLAPLPLLMAMAPHAVEQHLGKILADALRAVHSHPEFAAQSSRLRQLLSKPDLGLGLAAKQTRAAIVRVLERRADAQAVLHNPVDLLAKDRLWLPRDLACSALTEWAKNAANTPVCVITGEEGNGKTWLMFDWWRRHTDDESPPLVLWVAARDLTSRSLSEVIGDALSQWVSEPKKDSSFWLRRVQHWRSARRVPMGKPILWLMLDGANEGTAQAKLQQVLLDAVSSEWKGTIGILVSDRPMHFQRQFLGGKALTPPPAVIELQPFTMAEVEALLERHGKTSKDFSKEVLEIIRRPSWFAVAAQFFSSVEDWSAHSEEQLMVRYWQYRLLEKGKITTIDDIRFRDFIAVLGRQLRENDAHTLAFSRLQLSDMLAGGSGEPQHTVLEALDDITSGIWLKPAGRSDRFSVDRRVLSFAMGLALTDEVRAAATENEADQFSEAFLGPIADRDIGVEILKVSTSLAFNDASMPDYTKTALLKRWIGSHNFRSSHFELLWRIGNASRKAFLQTAEELWLARAGGAWIDEILVKSIVNIATQGGGETEIIAFMKKWASAYWVDPNEGRLLGYRATDDTKAKGRDETDSRVMELQQAIGKQVFAEVGAWRIDDGIAGSWIAHRIWSIATYLPRSPQGPLWRAWVFSRAIMDCPRHYDELAWSLRLNNEDSLSGTKSLLREFDVLYALPCELIKKQALTLLEAHAGKESAAQLAALGLEFVTRHVCWRDKNARIVNGVMQLSPDVKSDDSKASLATAQFAHNRSVSIITGDQQSLERYADAFPVNELSVGRSPTGADNILEMREEALARWAPESLAQLYRRLMLSVSNRDHNSLLGLTFDLEALLVLLTDDIQVSIERVLLDGRNPTRVPDEDRKLISRSLWAAALFDQSPSRQIALWRTLGAPTEVPQSFKHLIQPPSAEDLRVVATELDPNAEPPRLISWLGYLICARLKDVSELQMPLSRLFSHSDGMCGILL